MSLDYLVFFLLGLITCALGFVVYNFIVFEKSFIDSINVNNEKSVDIYNLSKSKSLLTLDEYEAIFKLLYDYGSLNDFNALVLLGDNKISQSLIATTQEKTLFISNNFDNRSNFIMALVTQYVYHLHDVDTEYISSNGGFPVLLDKIYSGISEKISI